MIQYSTVHGRNEMSNSTSFFFDDFIFLETTTILNKLFRTTGILSSISSFCVVIILWTSKSFWSRNIFSQLIFWVSLCDLFASIAISWGFPSQQMCVAQGALSLLMYRFSWFFAVAFDFELYRAILFGKTYMNISHYCLIIFSINIILEFIPISTNKYGADDFSQGHLICSFAYQENPTMAAIWTLVDLNFILAFCLILMIVLFFLILFSRYFSERIENTPSTKPNNQSLTLDYESRLVTSPLHSPPPSNSHSQSNQSQLSPTLPVPPPPPSPPPPSPRRISPSLLILLLYPLNMCFSWLPYTITGVLYYFLTAADPSNDNCYGVYTPLILGVSMAVGTLQGVGFALIFLSKSKEARNWFKRRRRELKNWNCVKNTIQEGKSKQRERRKKKSKKENRKIIIQTLRRGEGRSVFRSQSQSISDERRESRENSVIRERERERERVMKVLGLEDIDWRRGEEREREEEEEEEEGEGESEVQAGKEGDKLEKETVVREREGGREGDEMHERMTNEIDEEKGLKGGGGGGGEGLFELMDESNSEIEIEIDDDEDEEEEDELLEGIGVELRSVSSFLPSFPSLLSLPSFPVSSFSSWVPRSDENNNQTKIDVEGRRGGMRGGEEVGFGFGLEERELRRDKHQGERRVETEGMESRRTSPSLFHSHSPSHSEYIFY